MRRSPIPFKFKVIRPEPAMELTYLPKLGEPDVGELVYRLKGLGFAEPKVINDRPRVLRFAHGSASLRLMPRGLLMGPRGTFERLGSALDIHLRHEGEAQPALSWVDNDYQTLAPTQGGLVLHLRGRHAPPVRRFSAEVSRVGSMLSADEAFMLMATVEACGPSSIELLIKAPDAKGDLSKPIRLEERGFLHHVELSADEFLSKGDELLGESLSRACPFSPLPDSTIRLRGGSLATGSKGLEDALAALENWVSDGQYLAMPLGRR